MDPDSCGSWMTPGLAMAADQEVVVVVVLLVVLVVVLVVVVVGGTRLPRIPSLACS